MRRLIATALPLVLACTDSPRPARGDAAEAVLPEVRLEIEPQVLHFAPAYPEHETSRTLTLRNQGDARVEVLLSATPPFSSGDRVSVEPGVETDVRVSFAPAVPGNARGTLKLAWDGGETAVPLTGVVVRPPACASDACSAGHFDPDVGACVAVPVAEGEACGPSDCATMPVCAAGACVENAAEDGAACTAAGGHAGRCLAGTCHGPPEEMSPFVVAGATGAFLPALALDEEGNAYYFERSRDGSQAFLRSTSPTDPLRYRMPLPPPADGDFPNDAFEVAVAAGRIFRWGKGGVEARVPADGSLLWRQSALQLGGAVHALVELPQGIAVAAGDRLVAFGFDGEERWRSGAMELSTERNGYVADASALFLRDGEAIVALDATNGDELWRWLPENPYEPRAVAGGLLLGHNQAFEQVLRVADGERIAEIYNGQCFDEASLLLDGLAVTVCVGDAAISVIARSLRTGDLRWSHDVATLRGPAAGGWVIPSVATNNGSVLLTSTDCSTRRCDIQFHEITTGGDLLRSWRFPDDRVLMAIRVQNGVLYALDDQTLRLLEFPGYDEAQSGWTSEHGNNRASRRER